MSQALPPLPDQKARDEIINYPGHTFVTAGAGAGKSTTLARKIVRLIATGAVSEVSQVAAITFTRKAAAELKWKIEEEIERALHEPSLAPEQEKRLHHALDHLEDAIFGTIHSFCSEVLRRYALYAEVDPAFSIADENQAKIYMEEFFEQYIRRYWYSSQKDESRAIFETWKSIFFFQPSINIPTFLHYFSQFHEKYYLVENQSPESFAIADEKTLHAMAQTLFEDHRKNFLHLIEHYDWQAEAAKAPDSLGGRIEAFIPFLKEARTWSELDDLGPEITPGKKHGSKKLIAENSPCGDDTNKALKAYFNFLLDGDSAEFQKKAASFQGYPEIARNSIELPGGKCHSLSEQVLVYEYVRKLWYDACSHFESAYGKFKKQKSILDYQDLVYLTAKALAIDEARQELQKKISYLFVDEYQDTDPLQTQIFNTLCQTPANGSGGVKLFRVGDEKQSIYLFRGADLEIFRNEKESFVKEQSGYGASLLTNMRSYPEIVRFVNRLFEPGESSHELDLPGYEKMEILNRPQGSPPGTGVYLPRIDGYNKEEKSAGRRKAEAAWMARQIAELQKNRPEATTGLLFYSLSSIDLYIKEFEKLNIPYRLYGRKFYGENDLRRYLIHLLSCIRDPGNRLAYGGLLRSPFGGLSDTQAHDTLYFQERSAAQNAEKISELTRNLDQTLKKARVIARSRPLSHLLWFLYDKYALFFLDKSESRAYKESLWGALQKAGLLDSMAEPEGMKKIDFLIEYLSELEQVHAESGGEETGFESDHVQIMTYHKSKGLEFDFLFLGDLAYGFINQRDDFNIEKIQQEYRFYYTGDLSHYHLELPSPAEVSKRKREEERVRLLYVAMTRAKERLYLPLLTPERAAPGAFLGKLERVFSSKLGLLPEHWQESFEWQNALPEDGLYTAVFEASENPEKNAASSNTTQEFWNLSSREKTKTGPRYSFFSGTSLKKRHDAALAKEEALEEPELEKTGEFTGDAPVRRSFLPPRPGSWESLDALARGIIIHAIFEWVDLKNPVWDEHKTAALLYSNDLPEMMAAELDRIAGETLDVYRRGELFELIGRCRVTGKETGFSTFKHPEESRRQLGIGYIDLILEEPEQNEMIVVDYKTNVMGDLCWEEFEKKMLGSYEIPMGLYRETISDAFPGKKVSLCLYHTPTGKLIFYPTPEKLPQIDSLPELFSR